MEEKKNLKVSKDTTEKQKLSYEQLENVAHQLNEQVRQLYTKLQESNLSNLFKRLDYLFKVMENSTLFNNEFVEACKNEIQDSITLNNENTEVKEEDESLES